MFVKTQSLRYQPYFFYCHLVIACLTELLPRTLLVVIIKMFVTIIIQNVFIQGIIQYFFKFQLSSNRE